MRFAESVNLSAMGCGIYIHIPFCISKCAYCNFSSVCFEQGLAEKYARALLSEIHSAKPAASASTLYIGGGTPSILPVDGLISIIRAATERFGMAQGAEITVEANPGAIDYEKASALAEAGVTRLSLGVQYLDDRVLRTLGRAHDAQSAAEAAGVVREAGLSLSIDLMYGVPGQDILSWEDTIERALGLRPEHISAYELTPEKGTPLYDWLESGRLELPSEDDVIAMYRHAHERFLAAGFEHYEVSNYALVLDGQGRRSMHNVNYWERGEYIGLGASAHSFISETRCANLSEPLAYIEAIEQGKSPLAESAAVTPDEARREFLFLGLRMMDGISIYEAGASYGIKGIEERAAGLVRDGVFEIKDGRLRVSEQAVPVMNAAVVALMRVLGV